MSVTWPDARSLAVCRVLLGIAVVLNSAEVSATLGRIVEGSLAMPRLVPIPITAGAVEAWALIAFLSGGLVALGVLTQVSCLTATASFTFAMLWDQQTYTNHLWLTTLLVTFLAFARSDAQWSLRSAARRQIPSGSHLASLLMIAQLSVCYLFAALSKINPWWIAGDELRRSLRFDAPDAFYAALALGVVCAELFLATGIWFRGTRRLALVVGVGLHLSIVLLMHDRLPLFMF